MTHRNNANILTSVSDNCRPIFSFDLTNNQKTRFVFRPGRDFKTTVIKPKGLGSVEIDPVFFQI